MCGVLQVKEARGNVKNYLFRLVKEIAGLSALSFSHHLSKKCHGNKILFSPDEFTHFGNQQITVQFSFIFSTHMQPSLSVADSHSTCPHFVFTLVKTLTLFCTDGLMGVYQLSEGTSECAGLCVYAPVPVAAVCDS